MLMLKCYTVHKQDHATATEDDPSDMVSMFPHRKDEVKILLSVHFFFLYKIDKY